MLFDLIQRTYFGPARFSESQFAFLNRSARPAVGRIRDFFESWFSRYPEIARSDLRGRFRSNQRRQHLGAAFELYCSAILRGQSLEYASLLKPTGNNKTAPDFRVSSREGISLYLEATLVAESDEKVCRENVMNRFRDELDKTDSPNFFLRLRVDQYPSHSFSATRIRRHLESELSKLDPEEIADQFQNGADTLPYWEFNEGGGQFVFAPIPKKEEARGKVGARPIGAVTASEWVNARKPLVKSLRSKANKYGAMELPTVIAINCLDLSVEEEEVAEALFGRPLYHPDFYAFSDGIISNEAFWAAGQYTRVSAVLFSHLTHPSEMARTTPILWHNPFAARPLATSAWKGPQVVVDPKNQRIKRIEGMSGAEMLNVHPNWPK